jgi:CRISPR-associated protein Cmr1
MPLEIPNIPANWRPPTCDAGRSYEIELITPLFGGGVETRVNDPSFPIRPTSIRGQLQFWWRATVGAQYATRQELRAAQSAVWGNTEQASRVQVRVTNVHASEPTPCAKYEKDRDRPDTYRSMPTWNAPFNNNSLPYALFPFQGQLGDRRRQIEIAPAAFIEQAKFRLAIICHKDIDFARQVEPAIWAWVHFGGLGSRTRRGCGAIVCKALAPKDRNDLLAKLKTFLQAPSGPAREWPTLAESILVGRECSTGMAAWDHVIKLFRDFRQGVGLGRNPGERLNRPGRSRWPEPETIRRVTRQRLARHSRLTHIPDDAFPRAELGLPIVFHFQEQGDPPDTVLYPNGGRERMASPLILKPLALANDKFVPLIVRLKTPLLSGVDLRQGERSLPLPQPTILRDPKLATYRDSPMQNRSPSGSALQAFLAYAKSQEFTEVTR